MAELQRLGPAHAPALLAFETEHRAYRRLPYRPVPRHLRGAGTALAEGGVLDPGVIGRAVRDGHHDPQALTKVWAPSGPLRGPDAPGRERA